MTKNLLLWQYSKDKFSYIDKHYGLGKKLGVKIYPLSHRKAIIFTSKKKGEIAKLLDKFNEKYQQRVRI